MYLQADSRERRLLNQAFFERIEIDSEEISGHTLAAPFAQLVAPGLAEVAASGAQDGDEAAEIALRPGRAATAKRPRKAQTPGLLSKVGGLDVTLMVEPGGFEPPTFWLPARRSPN